jgi:hypothetical protein
MTSALAVRFFIDFSESGTLPAWLQRLALAQRLALMGCSALIVMAPLSLMPVLDRIYVWLFVALQALALTMTITALRRGSRAARVLLLSWTIPLLSCVMRIAYTLHLVSYTLLSDHAPLLAMSVNALLSSLAIALRVKILTEERDEARQEERIARRLADIDPLTGLLNRRGLLGRAALGQEPQRLLVIDVDHFKAINDGHGHDCGDAVLRDLAQLLTPLRRARSGGTAWRRGICGDRPGAGYLLRAGAGHSERCARPQLCPWAEGDRLDRRGRRADGSGPAGHIGLERALPPRRCRALRGQDGRA